MPCWDEREFDTLKTERADQRLTSDLLRKANIKGSSGVQSYRTLAEVRSLLYPTGMKALPTTATLDGSTSEWLGGTLTPARIERTSGPNAPEKTSQTSPPADATYEANETVLFLGHYWLTGDPQPLTANIACTDYSVTLEDGKLVAYRWSGERELSKSNFVSVPGRR